MVYDFIIDRLKSYVTTKLLSRCFEIGHYFRKLPIFAFSDFTSSGIINC